MKFQNKFIAFLSISALFTPFISCSDHNFKIDGQVEGAGNKFIVLEKSDFSGRWLPLDSTKIKGNVNFSISFPAPPSPDIYRLSLDGKFIYIPIDSTETINLKSSLAGFGTDFSLSGSRNAEIVEQFEKEILSFSSLSPDSAVSFKKGIFSKYMKDFPGSITGYYILTKTVDGKPVFDDTADEDIKYFAAVATGFESARPNDPHTEILKQTSLNALKRRNSRRGNYLTVEAEELKLIDINLQDENGQYIALSSVAGKGKPVVVVFSLLTHPDSPSLNIELAKIYNRLNGKAEFYNVALDPDQYSWRDAAKNIPWITVYSPGETASVEALKYNVSSLPSFFIINSEGEISSRPGSIEELDKSL